MAPSSAPASTATSTSSSAGPAPGSVSAADEYFRRYAATGDARAFRALVDGHLTMVHATAWRRLGEHGHLAADVAQAVFTRLARVARGLPQGIVIAAWLHRQAVRLAIDTVRAETRRRLRETAAATMLPTAPQSSTPPAGVHTLSGEIAPLLDEALDRLSETDRAALVLRYLEDRDLASVAASLKTTPEAARKRVARSLEKLRALLARRGVAVPAAATLSANLTQTQAQSAAAFLTNSTAATSTAAAKFSAAHISQTALASAASFSGPASTLSILTTLVMSHLPYAGAGAALVLIAAGLFYQQQESEIQRRLAARPAGAIPPAPAATAAPMARAAPGAAGRAAPDSADASGPRTLPEIIEALEKITSGPDGRLASLRISALLKKIPPAEYLEFYLTAETRLPAARWRNVVARSIAAWSPVDPGALVRALFDSDSAKTDVLRESRLRSSLALNSLEVQENPDGGTVMSKPVYSKPFQDWLKRDLPGAVRWVEQNAQTPILRLKISRHEKTLSETLLNMAAGQLAPGSPASSLNAIAGVPGDSAILSAWAKGQLAEGGLSFDESIARTSGSAEARALGAELALTNPDELRSWVRAAPTDSPVRFDAALGLIGAAGLKLSPGSMRTLEASEYRERAAFVLENAGTVPRSEALRSIAGTWMETTPEGMGELRSWLRQSGSPEETQDALETAARQVSQKWKALPEAMAFAAEITDPARRDPLLRGIFLRWQDDDPAAAAKFLATAPPTASTALEALTPPAQP